MKRLHLFVLFLSLVIYLPCSALANSLPLSSHKYMDAAPFLRWVQDPGKLLDRLQSTKFDGLLHKELTTSRISLFVLPRATTGKRARLNDPFWVSVGFRERDAWDEVISMGPFEEKEEPLYWDTPRFPILTIAIDNYLLEIDMRDNRTYRLSYYDSVGTKSYHPIIEEGSLADGSFAAPEHVQPLPKLEMTTSTHDLRLDDNEHGTIRRDLSIKMMEIPFHLDIKEEVLGSSKSIWGLVGLTLPWFQVQREMSPISRTVDNRGNPKAAHSAYGPRLSVLVGDNLHRLLDRFRPAEKTD